MQEPDDPNPIWTRRELAKHGRMSDATWHRNWRYDPRVVKKLIWISPRRLGMFASDWRAILSQGVSPRDGHYLPWGTRVADIEAIPPGKILVHNHVRPAERQGTRGFRFWLADAPPAENYEPCDCGWAPHLPVHYRVVRRS
jgi:hypothetical protein